MNRIGPSFSFRRSDFTMPTSRSDEISASASIYQARSSGPSGSSLMEAEGSGLLQVPGNIPIGFPSISLSSLLNFRFHPEHRVAHHTVAIGSAQRFLGINLRQSCQT